MFRAFENQANDKECGKRTLAILLSFALAFSLSAAPSKIYAEEYLPDELTLAEQQPSLDYLKSPELLEEEALEKELQETPLEGLIDRE